MPALVNVPDVREGELHVGGVGVTRLAHRVGSTPFFAYDRAALTRRVTDLRALLPRDVEISYAMKSNPMPALVHHMSTVVDSLDVASGGELKVALDTGIAPGQIDELIAAMMSGVTYVNVHTSDGVDPPNTGPGDFPGGEIRGQLD